MPGVITERLAVIIDAKAGGAISEFDKLSGKAATAGVETGGLSGAFQKMGLSAQTAGGLAVAATAGTVVGVGLLTAGAVASVRAVTGLADSVRGMQRVVGGTAEDASRLVAEFAFFGIATDTAEKGMFKFAATVGATPEKLTALGVALARDAQGHVSVAGTLKNLVDAYQSNADASKRAELARVAFGRAGEQYLPILAATKDRLGEIDALAQDSGHILSQEDLDNAKQYSLSLKIIGETFKGIELSLGKELLPRAAAELKNLAIGFERLVLLAKGEGWKQSGIDARNMVEGAIAVQTQGDAMKKAAAASDEMTKSSQTLEQATLTNITAAQGITTARLGVVAATRSLADAQREASNFARVEREEQAADLRSVASAHLGVADAQAHEVDATRSLNRLMTDLADGTLGVAAAQRTLRGATLDTADAQDRLRDAQKAYDDLVNPSDKTKADAALKVKEAQQGIADAEQRVREAVTASNRARGQDRVGALNDVERANLDLQKATESLSQAQADEERTLGIGSDAAKDRQRADRELQRAKLIAEDATVAQRTAQKDADDAAVVGALDVAAHIRAVDDAHNAVIGSIAAENQANQKLADDNATRADQEKATLEKVTTAENNLLTAKNGVLGAILGANKAEEDFQKLLDDPAVVNKAIGDLDRLGTKYNEILSLAGQLSGKANFGDTYPDGTPKSLDYNHPERHQGGTASSASSPLHPGVPGTTVLPARPDQFNSQLGTPAVIHVQVDGKTLATAVTTIQQRSSRSGGMFQQ